MTQVNFLELNNEKLLNDIKVMKAKESKAIAEFVLYLAEIDRRELYRDAGYSSLFNYCVDGLKYSEGAAYRRIQAARCLKEHIEVYEKLKNGSLTLCTVSQLYRVINNSNKEELLRESESKSKLQLERMIAPLLPPEKAKRDTIRAKVVEVKLEEHKSSSPSESQVLVKAEERFSISAEVDSEVIGLIDEAKEILGNVPLASGGKNNSENLRLLCFKHNQLMAERHFGKDLIRKYRT